MNVRKDPLETDAREYAWWGASCPLAIVADSLRGRPEKREALVFLFKVWIQHRDRCTATRPGAGRPSGQLPS